MATPLRIPLIARIAVASIALYGATAVAANLECGSLVNGYGPYDYRTSKRRLHIVEIYHFTPDVEALRAGSTGTIGADLDYTLRASPNHHRALNAMMNLAFKQKKAKPRGAHYSIDCYFDRAIRFAPDDGDVQALYGIYLSRINRKKDAVKAFENAVKLEPDNPNVHYNLGLVYLDLKDYANALEQAHLAYRLGSQLSGLRDKLKESGHWREPATPSAANEGSMNAHGNVED